MESSDDYVTVIDPRHPLCNQTFRLLGITTKQYLGRCCVVLDHALRERNIPLVVTDHWPDPLVITSSPLTVATIEHLIHVFSHIHPQPGTVMGEADGKDAAREYRDPNTTQSAMEQADRTHLNSSPDLHRAGLVLPLASAATDGCRGSCQDLSGRSTSSREAKRGGRRS